MTTLRDLIQGFQTDSIIADSVDYDVTHEEEALARREALEDLLDQLMENIKERLIG